MSSPRLSFVFLLATLLLAVSTSSAFAPFKARISSITTSSLVSLAASTETAEMAEVKVGDKLPQVELMELTSSDGKPEKVDLLKLIAGKKVAIFGVPGAFTPGCSKSHLPSFMEAQGELKEKGVELTICIATNDAFVMEAWGRTSGGSDAGIRFLADGSAELTKALGLAMDSPAMIRTKRFSLIAEDGVVTHYFSSKEQSSDTWAPAVLSKL